VASPCGQLCTPPKKEGWANKSIREIEKEKRDERKRRQLMRTEGVSAADALGETSGSEVLWTKCTWEEWERSWVAARMTEDKARLRKSENARQQLQARCRTPYTSVRDAKALIDQPAQYEAKVKRRPGSPRWHSKARIPDVFAKKQGRAAPRPLSTPPHLDSPFKDPLPQPVGSQESWNDEALCPGGMEPPLRPQTAPPELWRREIVDGRGGPSRSDLEVTR